MPYTFTVAKAPEDVPDLVHLINSCYRGEEATKGWTTEAGYIEGVRTTNETLTKEMQQPNMFIIKGVDDETGKVIGCVFCQREGQQLDTGLLCVSPTLQSKGIGRMLMTEAEKHAKNIGCTALRMQVISIRDTLIAWYQRLGFRPTGKVIPFPPAEANVGIPKHPLEFIELVKELGQE